MPSVETRQAKNGGRPTYKVRFRHAGKQTSRTFTIKRDAESFARQVDRQGPAITLATESVPAGTPTLDEWAERYFAMRTGIDPNTIIKDRRIYEAQWKPALGSLPITLVDRVAVATVMNKIERADKTIKNYHGVLSSMMKVAVQERVLDRNPCHGMKLPRRTEHNKTQMRFLTVDEYDRILVALPAHWHPLVETLVGTGMRWGEAEALLVSDVVNEPGYGAIRIVKSAKKDVEHGGTRIGPTKTQRSNRTVTIDDDLLAILAPLLEGRRGDERLFTSLRGGPISNSTFYDVWSVALVNAEVFPRPRVHDLRHTHVAWLIQENVNLVVIQDRLGHESIQTTIDVYGGLYEKGQRAAALAMQRVRQTTTATLEVVAESTTLQGVPPIGQIGRPGPPGQDRS